MNENKSFIDRQPLLLQFFIFLFLMLGCTSIFTYASFILIKPLFGIDGADLLLKKATENADALKENINEINALKFIQLLTSVGTFLVPSILFGLAKNPGHDFLKLRSKTPLLFFFFSAAIIFLSAPIINEVYEWNKNFDFNSFGSFGIEMKNAEKQNQLLTNIFLFMPSFQDFMINILIVAVVPAVAEELFFRGVLQQLIKEASKSSHLAVWMTAVLFSAFHFDITGFIPRVLLGALLGYVFLWSGNLLVSMTGHFINNAAQVVLVYLFQTGNISYDASGDEPTPFYITVIFTLAMIATIYFFYKKRVMVKEEIPTTDSTIDSMMPPGENG
ncbi:MAG TPA: hypothetical protein DCQ93_01290 [Bacteroidetes bacterium]|nr:hypothetical protein [Bacteroidota bacterium]